MWRNKTRLPAVCKKRNCMRRIWNQTTMGCRDCLQRSIQRCPETGSRVYTTALQTTMGSQREGWSRWEWRSTGPTHLTAWARIHSRYVFWATRALQCVFTSNLCVLSFPFKWAREAATKLQILTWLIAESLSHTAEKRATVNILNAPFGQDPQDYININKHFELPVSTENEKRLGEDRGAIFYERQSLEPTSYSSRLPGLSAILAWVRLMKGVLAQKLWKTRGHLQTFEHWMIAFQVVLFSQFKLPYKSPALEY